MSQGAATSLPPSRPPSRSPPNAGITPETLQHGSAPAPSEQAEQTRLARVRSTIDDVLNPPEHQPSSGKRTSAPPVGEAAGQGLGPTLAPAAPHTAPTRAQLQVTGADQRIGRGVPPPLPDGSRRILSPRAPRAASASYAYPQIASAPQLSAGGPEIVPTHPQDGFSTPSRAQIHQLPPISSAASLPGTPSLSITQPARTNSQPSLGPTHLIAPASYASSTRRRPWPAPNLSSQPLSNAEDLGAFPRSVSTSSLGPPAGWQSLLRERQGLGSEGNDTMTGTLPDGSEIPLTIDVITGSSKQSQKRSRNAEASGRHRSKRKAQTSDMQKEIESLKEEREVTHQRLEDLARERDFYREERNRLRDLVSRTSQIAHMATGPPSPGVPETQIDTAPRGSNIQEISSTEQRRRSQAHTVTHIAREGQSELLAQQREHDVYGRTQQGRYGDSLSREPSHGPTAVMAPSFTDHGPSAATRIPGVPQLPPIGVMSGNPPHPPTQGQAWEQDRQAEQWAHSRGRPHPGWTTGGAEAPSSR